VQVLDPAFLALLSPFLSLQLWQYSYVLKLHDLCLWMTLLVSAIDVLIKGEL
jgi:hypothetical protein